MNKKIALLALLAIPAMMAAIGSEISIKHNNQIEQLTYAMRRADHLNREIGFALSQKKLLTREQLKILKESTTKRVEVWMRKARGIMKNLEENLKLRMT